MERLRGIRHIYKPLRWLLVGFLALAIVIPLVQRCVIGLFQGESCDRRRIVDFVLTYYPWMLAILVLLGGMLLVSWWAQRGYQARQPFELMKPVGKLRPEDLRFHPVERGDLEIEEVVAQDQRPYHKHAYVSRTAIEYAARGKPNPQPRYTEVELVELLRKGKGFTLQGPPTDGKSRTLYEVIRRMDGYDVVSPKSKDGPGDEDVGLLLKGRKVVLLLDDLTNYAGAELDLHELGKSLTRNRVRWVVACTCRDGPELESVRNAQKKGLRAFYGEIPLKLKLLDLTAAEKERLARNLGREWTSGSSEQYPTPGSITMEHYKRFMHERFETSLTPVQRDALRALKLLKQAGILPVTHHQVEAVLKAERLFDWPDVHLQRDCLDGLREDSFISLAPDQNEIRPEPAYLTDDVVPYTMGKEPEQDFDALMQILEEIEDATGLFFLGNSFALNLRSYQKAIRAYDAALAIRPDDAEALNNRGGALGRLGRYEEAIRAYDAALEVRPDYAEALYNRGNALDDLGRHEEAIRAYDAALEVRPDYADALYNKVVVLLEQGREEEALDHLCKSWERRERLPDGGAALAELFVELGREPGECS